jgi:SAM-dependent methyltransferase
MLLMLTVLTLAVPFGQQLRASVVSSAGADLTSLGHVTRHLGCGLAAVPGSRAAHPSLVLEAACPPRPPRQAMLDLARHRAEQLGRGVDLRLGDALALSFDDGCFDTVVCTFSLCEIPNNAQAIAEMHRVLRPGGIVLLADHVASTSRALRIIQRGIELITIPLGGEHFLRRPSQHLAAAGFEIEHQQRFTAGIVERLSARKPAHPGPNM